MDHRWDVVAAVSPAYRRRNRKRKNGPGDHQAGPAVRRPRPLRTHTGPNPESLAGSCRPGNRFKTDLYPDTHHQSFACETPEALPACRKRRRCTAQRCGIRAPSASAGSTITAEPQAPARDQRLTPARADCPVVPSLALRALIRRCETDTLQARMRSPGTESRANVGDKPVSFRRIGGWFYAVSCGRFFRRGEMSRPFTITRHLIGERSAWASARVTQGLPSVRQRIN